jgi:hypothetical protein
MEQMKQMNIPQYKPRFVSESQLTELMNLYRTSQTAEAYQRERKLWASREFVKKYPDIKSTGAYKDLTACLEHGYNL